MCDSCVEKEKKDKIKERRRKEREETDLAEVSGAYLSTAIQEVSEITKSGFQGLKSLSFQMMPSFGSGKVPLLQSGNSSRRTSEANSRRGSFFDV